MKKDKPEAQALTDLANKLLQKEIREEDLRANPDKIEQFAKILDRSLSKIYDDWKPVSGEETMERKVNEILYYYRLLKFACIDEKKFNELLGLWYPRVPEKLKEMGEWKTFLELDEQYEELESLRMNEDGLWDLIMRLRKCKNKTCGKWFVLTSKHKKEFCNHHCAAKYTERMKREKKHQEFLDYHRDYRKKKKEKEEAQATLSKKHEEK